MLFARRRKFKAVVVRSKLSLVESKDVTQCLVESTQQMEAHFIVIENKSPYLVDSLQCCKYLVYFPLQLRPTPVELIDRHLIAKQINRGREARCFTDHSPRQLEDVV